MSDTTTSSENATATKTAESSFRIPRHYILGAALVAAAFVDSTPHAVAVVSTAVFLGCCWLDAKVGNIVKNIDTSNADATRAILETVNLNAQALTFIVNYIRDVNQVVDQAKKVNNTATPTAPTATARAGRNRAALENTGRVEY